MTNARVARRVVIGLLLIAATMPALVFAPPAQAAWTAPQQPTSGPGGNDYCFASSPTTGVRRVFHDDPTNNSYDYWTYTPLAASWGGPCAGSSVPTHLPITVVLHGQGTCGYELPLPTPPTQPTRSCNQWDDSSYIDLLRHIAQKGSTVIFPRYQDCPAPAFICAESPNVGDNDGADIVETVLASALTWMAGDAATTIKPWTKTVDANARMVIVGNSRGAIVGTNLANGVGAGSGAIPPAAAILAISPGDLGTGILDSGPLSGLPSYTNFTCMIGTDDVFNIQPALPVADFSYNFGIGELYGCDRVWSRLPSGLTDRQFLRVQSDRLGEGANPYTNGGHTTANHLMALACPASWSGSLSAFGTGGSAWPTCNDPSGDNNINVLDWSATYKLSVGLKDCLAWAGVSVQFNCTYANQASTDLTGMGNWVDGATTQAFNPIIRYASDPNLACYTNPDPYVAGFTPCAQYREPIEDFPTTGLSGASNNGFEVSSWKARTNDNQYAENVDGVNNRHVFKTFGFDMLSGASYRNGDKITVSGIEASVDWKSFDGTGSPRLGVELSYDGGTTWLSKDTSGRSTGNPGTDVLGGSTDTWGHAWNVNYNDTLANIAGPGGELMDTHRLNPEKFQVRLTSKCASSCPSQDWMVDWVGVKVYWSGSRNRVADPGFEYGSTEWVKFQNTVNQGAIGVAYGQGNTSYVLNDINGTSTTDPYVVQTISAANYNHATEKGYYRLEAQGDVSVAGKTGVVVLTDQANNWLCYLTFSGSSTATPAVHFEHKATPSSGAGSCNTDLPGVTGLKVWAYASSSNSTGYAFNLDGIGLQKL